MRGNLSDDSPCGIQDFSLVFQRIKTSYFQTCLVRLCPWGSIYIMATSNFTAVQSVGVGARKYKLIQHGFPVPTFVFS